MKKKDSTSMQMLSSKAKQVLKRTEQLMVPEINQVKSVYNSNSKPI
jgi:hypothetical protein